MLPVDTAIRAKRLLAGEADISDIDRLLINLRDSVNGFPIVREMGDFVAHSAVREKGLSFDVANPSLAIFRLYVHRELKLPVSRAHAQVAFRGYAQLSRNRLSKSERTLSAAWLESICDAVQGHDGTQWHFDPPLLVLQLNFLNKICSAELRPAFDQGTYAAQLLKALKSLNLVSDRAEMKFGSAGARLIAKHAVVRLHGAKINAPMNERISLTASFERGVSIGASLPFYLPGKTVDFSLSIFEANLDPLVDCSYPLSHIGNQILSGPLDLQKGKIVLLR